MSLISNASPVGFGTAALGTQCASVVYTALQAGFRTFDTAEAEYWYDQKAVGQALERFFTELPECEDIATACYDEGLSVYSKIPPWELTSIENIQSRAKKSQETLLGFCNERDENSGAIISKFPLDTYFIHAPHCWKGWHAQCVNGDEAKLSLREAWLGMEQVFIDGTAKRIGLSNVREDELKDIIVFVQERQKKGSTSARMPDVLQQYSDPLRPATRIRELCKEFGIEFLSFSTLGTQHSMQHRGANPVLNNDVILRLADLYERSTAEIVLSWALQRNMSVIPRSSKKNHIQQLSNLIYEQDGFLAEEHLLLIDSLSWE